MLKFKPASWLTLAMGVSVSACGSSGHGWSEEVQLNSGKVIVVERKTILESGGGEWASNRSGKKPREYQIRFAAPDETMQTIEWRSSKKSPRGWPEKPLVFDVEAGRPIVVASVHVIDGCEVYMKYIFQNGAWTELALPEQFERRQTNLLIRDGINMPEVVTLQEKLKDNAGLSYRPALKYVGPRRKVCG